MDRWRHVKCTLKRCFDSRSDSNIALLQIQTTLLGQGVPSHTTRLFNHPITDIMPVINRPPIGIDNDDEHHKVIIKRQTKMTKVLPKILCLSPLGLLQQFIAKMGDHGPKAQ